jgi:hypothetical protein
MKGAFMSTLEVVSQCGAAAEEFDLHEHRGDGLQVIEGLCGGLTLVRDTFFNRVHSDVEFRVGKDSILLPISAEKAERSTKVEIEAYQVAVSAAAAEDCGYVADAAWYREWLARLRLDSYDAGSRAARRIIYYAGKSATDQRLAFSNVLATVLPESGRSPLVLLRLLPLAVQVATALAFGKSADAMRWRHEQREFLPSIGDCHHCRGALLENGEQCAMCGNPLWSFEWLTAADG